MWISSHFFPFTASNKHLTYWLKKRDNENNTLKMDFSSQCRQQKKNLSFLQHHRLEGRWNFSFSLKWFSSAAEKSSKKEEKHAKKGMKIVMWLFELEFKFFFSFLVPFGPYLIKHYIHTFLVLPAQNSILMNDLPACMVCVCVAGMLWMMMKRRS